ncbi:MAG: HAD hydrolase-like protein [Hyphomonadaceae bacterium]|nr:MAG: phosphoglycolate phosphatase [Caulobacteraceae bacterium]MBT9447364.1 HAD hydrolase-like protein [Hyphomonadaceae bacterium]TPW07444.1 MAG: phosphoglycolate phosphatase [Alphaproteobacteria bacterium]
MRDLEGATVVFDLDGTLVDTAPDLLRALDEVMADEGLPSVPAEELRRMVGQGAQRLIVRAAARHGISWPEEKLIRLTEKFVDVYAADIARDSRPFPGVPAALDALLTSGAVLSVCTNKRTGLSEKLLSAVGLRSKFAAVVGSDSAPQRKPAAGHYLAAVAHVAGDPRRSVMVGDSAADVGAAKAAGAPVIVYRFGYCEEDVGTLGADVLISEFTELGVAVRRLL